MFENINALHFAAFIIYAVAVFVLGVFLYSWINVKKEKYFSTSVFFGEAYLLGSIALIGAMLLLSVIHLYKGWLLWSLVLLSYLPLLSSIVRSAIKQVFLLKSVLTPANSLFILLLAFFIFRNCYFLVDVDSHSTYLFAQKLWLHYGTSVLPDPGIDMRTFTPHFNAVPYALGIVLFGEETLFAQLIVASWTVALLLVVYGYTKYRLGEWLALAACLFVLLDDHMFYSGANQCCIINSALIAFIFAAVYSFWEAREQNSTFRFILGLIFLSQLIANKYQAIYITAMILMLGCFIQPNLMDKIKVIFSQRKWIIALIGSALVTALWLIKNWLATGCPTFPILAGTFGALNWTIERQQDFLLGCGKLDILTVIKYISYFFIWHGVVASKYLWLLVVFLPLLMTRLLLASKPTADYKKLIEMFFWVGMSILLTIGIVLTNYTDPRVYRYNIAVISFALVFSLSFIFVDCWKINKKFILIAVLLLSLSGSRMFLYQGGMFQTPTLNDNLNVLLNKLHMQDMVSKYFPNIIVLNSEMEKGTNLDSAAWDMGVNGFGARRVSAFLLPVMPHLDLWHTSIVKWDSYNSAQLIVEDLKVYGIKSVLGINENQVSIQTLEEYAAKAVKLERKPTTIFYDYGFPKELTVIK